MKKLKLIIAAMTLATTALASQAQAAIEVSGDAYVGYFSKYVWRGFDLSGGMPVVQGGVDLSAKGFTLSYWTNVAIRNDDVNNNGILDSADGDFEGGEGTENDLVLNYAIPVGELATINVGNIYYMLDGYDDTNEVYAGATFNTLLSPTVKIFYDWDKADENGLYYTASVSHSLPVSEILTLGASALVGYNDENYSVSEDWSDWHNYELSAKADIKVTEQLTITPSILYSSPISDDAKDKIDSQLVGGVNMMFAF